MICQRPARNAPTDDADPQQVDALVVVTPPHD
jgi:hypothetical protein